MHLIVLRMVYMATVISVLFCISLSGCLYSTEHESSLVLAAVSTSKQVYTFGDILRLTVEVKTEEFFDDLLISVRGLQNKIGNYHLQGRKIVDVSPGINRYVIDFVIPPCSSCTKLDSGTYHITVALIYREQEVDSKTVEVELYQ